MDSRPYDVVHLWRRQGGKWVGSLVRDCTLMAPYRTDSVTAMYSVVIELVQFGVCVPFVRDSYLRPPPIPRPTTCGL
jgi:hypothetical protein